jgi:hypothetical protein
MKKNVVYLVVFIILLAVAGYLLMQREGKSTLKRTQNYDFTIKDTAAVDKIIISDKRPSKVTLTRTKRGWMVDGESLARRDAIQTLLLTLNRMEMRNFLPERLKETAIKRMAVHGKKVEVFKNGEPFKTFYVGTESQDEMATYMMIEGSDAPYAVSIPGFNGFLSTRFFANGDLWRSRTIFATPSSRIRKLEVLYPEDPKVSFEVNRFSADSLYIKRVASGEIMQPVNKVNLKLFLSTFEKLSYEGAIVSTDAIYAKRDSLLASTPAFVISLTDTEGSEKTLTAFHIKAAPEMAGEDGLPLDYDPDRLHAFINKEKMVLVQYYGLRNALIVPEFFQLAPTIQ